VSWEQRLREMLLAGGALAAVACGGKAAVPVDSGADDAAGEPDSPEHEDAPGGPSFCCNAAPDPCCDVAYCEDAGGPNGSAYAACETMYCASQGTQFVPSDGGFGPHCTASPEGGPGDAGAGDDGPD
jgi:hypothetical protein